MPSPRLVRIVKSAYRRLSTSHQTQIRKGDVFLVSYPRSGSTWVRFLLANVIRTDSAQAIDFHSVHSVIPDFSIPEQRPIIDGLPDPRIIKSHSAYDRRFPRVIYLIRDGRDVMVSYYDFLIKNHRFEGSFADFLLDSHIPYGLWEDHVRSWLDARDRTDLLVVRYEDLLDDAQRELRRMASFTGIASTSDILERAVRASAFDQMQSLEETRGRPYGDSAHRFVRRGAAGGWLGEFSEDCRAIFKSRAGSLLRELGYANAADW